MGSCAWTRQCLGGGGDAKRVCFKADFAVFWDQKEVVGATKCAKHTDGDQVIGYHVGWFECKWTPPWTSQAPKVPQKRAFLWSFLTDFGT